MDTSLRLINAEAPGYTLPARQLQGTEEIAPLAQKDVAQISQAPAQEAGNDQPADGKSKFKEVIGKAVKFTAGVIGGAVGFALSPIGGTAFGAYGGMKGRPYIQLDAFSDPGFIGAEIHKKIENKTGSNALAIAGGTIAGIPGGILYAAVMFPVLGFVMSYEYADKLLGK